MNTTIELRLSDCTFTQNESAASAAIAEIAGQCRSRGLVLATHYDNRSREYVFSISGEAAAVASMPLVLAELKKPKALPAPCHYGRGFIGP